MGVSSISRPTCGPVAKDEIQSLGAVPGDLDMIAQMGLLQRMQGQFQILGVVLDQQNFDAVAFVHDVAFP